MFGIDLLDLLLQKNFLFQAAAGGCPGVEAADSVWTFDFQNRLRNFQSARYQEDMDGRVPFWVCARTARDSRPALIFRDLVSSRCAC
jgi:hypothetical protein